MTSVAPPKPLAPLPEPRAPEPPANIAAAAAEKQFDDHAAAMRHSVLPNKVDVKLDEDAGRFIHTLTDISTEEVLRRYPSEAQLAYSRAVMTYLRRLADVNDA